MKARAEEQYRRLTLKERMALMKKYRLTLAEVAFAEASRHLTLAEGQTGGE
jgi:hypothetical protein